MTTALIQARMRSTRLPGKIFLPIAGQPLIWHVVTRAQAAQRIDDVVIATSTAEADDQLVDWCRQNGITCTRGDEHDVLGRFAAAAAAVNATEAIVRITADDPLKDPRVIDATIDLFHSAPVSIASNNVPPSFPEGLDVEVFSRAALDTAAAEAIDPFEREHVTQFFYRRPERFPHQNLHSGTDDSDLRLTIDTENDLALTRAIHEALGPGALTAGWRDVVALLRSRPDLIAMNASVQRSALYQ